VPRKNPEKDSYYIEILVKNKKVYARYKMFKRRKFWFSHLVWNDDGCHSTKNDNIYLPNKIIKNKLEEEGNEKQC
jgi:hypothetical protein